MKSLLSIPAKLFGQGARVAGTRITQTTPTGAIEGSLIVPVSSGSVPVALIIAGSGPTDRDGNNKSMKNNSLRFLAIELKKLGIASLRYDKRGIGASRASGLSEENLSFENYIQDAEGWIEILGKDDRFSEVIVIGHSEGSLIGMVASRHSNVSKYISLAGVGKKASEVLLDQLGTQPEEIRENSRRIIERLLKGEVTNSIDPSLRSLFRPSVQPYLISWFKYNPVDEVSRLEIPVLVIQGTADMQVPVEHANLLAEANNRAEVVLIEDMNHILKKSVSERSQNIATYNMPKLDNHPALVQEIQKFLSS